MTTDYDFLTTTLDCWGGRYAIARYNFGVPASAFSFRWTVRGTPTGADLCCDGRITRTGHRIKPRLFQVRVRVTGWRAYEIRGVSLTYTYKVRR